MTSKLFVIASFDFKRDGVELKAGASAWLPYDLACALASSGAVNIPRKQPEPPAIDSSKPVNH